jgi:hypothetical protein
MPLIRKLINVGDSKAITIPPSWLLYIERTTGQKVTEVIVEVNSCINIKPFLQEKTAL